MRRFLPDSLPVWTIMILLTSFAVVEISTIYLLAREQESYGRMAELFHLKERVLSTTRAVVRAPAAARPYLAASLSNATQMAEFENAPRVTERDPADSQLAEFLDVLQGGLSELGPTDVRVSRQHDLPPDLEWRYRAPELGNDASKTEKRFQAIAARYSGRDLYIVSVDIGENAWLNFFFPIVPARSFLLPETLGAGLVILALVLATATWSLRRLTAPYGALGSAADRLGANLDSNPLPEIGVREARQASHAFNLMCDRLKRLLSERQLLAAAVAHDLRTPVTRLRLRAEMIPDRALKQSVLGDLDEMEAMTQSILSFARENASGQEAHEKLDLFSLTRSLCYEMPRADFIEPESAQNRLIYVGQPLALKRCIANLIDNAIKHGGDAKVSIGKEDDGIRVRIDDDGPGLPESKFADAFEPFRRLTETSQTGGTGLGLAIARNIARAHGGDVELRTRSEGGLRAELFLPALQLLH